MDYYSAIKENVVHWRREQQTTSVFLPCESHEQNEKAKRYDTYPRLVGAQYATGDQWRNNFKRMKGWSQSKNITQLWMGLVIEARSDAVKSNIA